MVLLNFHSINCTRTICEISISLKFTVLISTLGRRLNSMLKMLSILTFRVKFIIVILYINIIIIIILGILRFKTPINQEWLKKVRWNVRNRNYHWAFVQIKETKVKWKNIWKFEFMSISNKQIFEKLGLPATKKSCNRTPKKYWFIFFLSWCLAIEFL